MKIAMFSSKSYDRKFFNKINADFDFEIQYLDNRLDKNTTKLAEGYDVVCVFVNDKLDREVIAQLAKNGIKLIALRAAGFNNVDLEAADRQRIKVVRVPAYSPNAVAEHAVGLILTLNRKIHKAYNRVREGNFSLERLTGFDMKGKTVGVVGTGNIGRVFCQIVMGFGCRVIAYDKYPSDECRERGIEYVELNELFNKSDIISLHCPLTPETCHLIDSKAIEKMKDGVMLINTSRGKLINHTDVIKGLKSKRIGYLGIDVYEQEEKLFFKDLSERVIRDDVISRLMTFPNVLITSHQAFFTENALNEIATTTLQNVKDFEQNKELKNEVNIELVKK